MQAVAPMSTGETVLVISMMRAISIFRWVTLVWATIGLVLGRGALVRPWTAIGLLALAGLMTAFLHVVGRRQPLQLVSGGLLASEVALGLILLIGDGLVFADDRAQSLPWAWPAAGIAAVGVAASGRASNQDRRRPGDWYLDHAGLLVALLVGAVSLFAEVVLLNRIRGTGELGTGFSKIGLWLVVGMLVGPLMRRLLRAERLISVVKAREDLARQLHDGVLQTLAVVQRRSPDPELAILAREQENSLRVFLSDARLVAMAAEDGPGSNDADPVALTLDDETLAAGLDTVLRRVLADAERLHRFRGQVVVAPDCPSPPPSVTAAVAGAVTEALTNAGKHGRAERVTIFAEPADGDEIFVSVNDNGTGFDVDQMTEGIGLSRSIRARITEQGGRVEIASRPGKGTEVQLWVRAVS